MLRLWMVLRYLKKDRKGRLTLFLSVLGMSFGIAALILSMAIISGYESTLKKSILDSFGHVVVLRKGVGFQNNQNFSQELKELLPEMTHSTPFYLLEALMAHNKNLAGVVVEGVDLESHSQVIQLQKHMIAGEFRFGEEGGLPLALVGKGVQKKFKLKVGDSFRLVLPMTNPTSEAAQFRSKVQKFVLAGVVDLGRHDFDERYIVTDLSTAQKWAQVGSRISGYKLKLSNPDLADEVKVRFEEKYGYPYVAQTWFESNRNIFLAAKFEKIVIFFIVMLMVVAASFNVSSHLYVTALKRYHDMSILKALGASQKFIYWMFATQGLVVGALGALLGIALGFSICELFMWVQERFPLFPAEIYRIDKIHTEIKFTDLMLILSASMFVCFLASLIPARRGSRLEAVEGLRYE